MQKALRKLYSRTEKLVNICFAGDRRAALNVFSLQDFTSLMNKEYCRQHFERDEKIACEDGTFAYHPPRSRSSSKRQKNDKAESNVKNERGRDTLKGVEDKILNLQKRIAGLSDRLADQFTKFDARLSRLENLRNAKD